ncbi:hypothetical protein DDB_G0292728, partial [Dictyostelium discoideum AX4]
MNQQINIRESLDISGGSGSGCDDENDKLFKLGKSLFILLNDDNINSNKASSNKNKNKDNNNNNNNNKIKLIIDNRHENNKNKNKNNQISKDNLNQQNLLLLNNNSDFKKAFESIDKSIKISPTDSMKGRILQISITLAAARACSRGPNSPYSSR